MAFIKNFSPFESIKFTPSTEINLLDYKEHKISINNKNTA